tara:strand:+ start:801 stop:911 length:111 start_codon:yes stop_codon:yes gene_type:complete
MRRGEKGEDVRMDAVLVVRRQSSIPKRIAPDGVAYR